MLRTLAALTVLLAGSFAFADSGAQAADPPQTLGVVLHHNRAATERLPHYRTAAPIAINVGGRYARRLHTLTLTARGPRGESFDAPLTRSGDTFSGNLTLTAPGTWTVAFSTKLGTVPAALTNFTLDAVSADAADLAIRLTLAIAALSILAGLALVLRVDGRPLAFVLSATKRS
ncbi:MAG TPA: hypothetical protein VGP41_00290 [Candidatus Lustribacter sp.]|nr:hypothetical protein [Candidatus Lustribacter sp.]